MVETVVKYLSDFSFGDLILGAKGWHLVNFYTASSPECQKLGVIIQDLAGRFRKKVVMAKLDVEKNPAITARYKVTITPTLILFKDGQEVDRITGFVNEENLSTYLNQKIKEG
jgi:thioredoxin 1